MKVLKIIGIIVLVLIVIVMVVVAVTPSSASLERSITVNSSADVVYAEVNNLKTFNKWSPWFQADPNAEYVWEGGSTGVGAKMTWYSEDKNVGNGFMTIVESTPASFVKYEMGFDQNGNKDFTDEGDEKPYASMIIEESSDQTNVTWTFEISGISTFNVGSKMMVLALDMFLGPFYEKGLLSLKDRIENRPEYTVDIGTTDVESISFLGVGTTTSLDPDEIGKAMGEAYGKIVSYMTRKKIEQGGYPIAVVNSYDDSGMDMVCGIPVVDGTESDSEEISVNASYAGTVVKAVHMGDYAASEVTHEQIDQYIKYNGYESVGAPWEEYVTDPGLEPDTAKWVTNIYYPVK